MTRVVRISEVSARLVPHRWEWAEENAGPIADHWARRRAARPALFNGRVLMLAGLEFEGTTCEARFFETDYAAVIAWLDLDRPGEPVLNGFAMGALQGRDGGFILGRMAPHTANAGQLYFPAGTPDRSDVTDAGEVDLAGSLEREITEETGLAPADWSVDQAWTIVEVEGRVAFMRAVRLTEDADTACIRIRRFLARDARPELADVTVVSSPAALDPVAMPAFLTAYLEAAWGTQSE